MAWTFLANEIDIKPRLTYNTYPSAYNSVDVSADVPAGTTGVVIHARSPNSGNKRIDVRPVGCTVDHSQYSTLALSYHKYLFVKLNASHVFEAFVESAPSTFGIVAHTNDTATNFSTVVEDKSITGDATYRDVDVSALAPAGSVIALMKNYIAGTGVGYLYDLTYDEAAWNKYYQVYTTASDSLALMPLPASLVGRGKAANNALDWFYLGGLASPWVKVAPPTSVDISGLTADAWQTITLSTLPDGVSGVAIMLYNGEGTTRNFGVRTTGSTNDLKTNIQVRTINKQYAILGVNEKQIDVYCATNYTSKELHILGYYVSGSNNPVGNIVSNLWGSPLGSTTAGGSGSTTRGKIGIGINM